MQDLDIPIADFFASNEQSWKTMSHKGWPKRIFDKLVINYLIT